jgi:hypothetical protein
MWLRTYERRGKWYWRLFDARDRLIAASPRGYRSFELCKDYARYAMEGLRNCLQGSR